MARPRSPRASQIWPPQTSSAIFSCRWTGWALKRSPSDVATECSSSRQLNTLEHIIVDSPPPPPPTTSALSKTADWCGHEGAAPRFYSNRDARGEAPALDATRALIFAWLGSHCTRNSVWKNSCFARKEVFLSPRHSIQRLHPPCPPLRLDLPPPPPIALLS
jgi:hypothetical protein